MTDRSRLHPFDLLPERGPDDLRAERQLVPRGLQRRTGENAWVDLESQPYTSDMIAEST